MWGAPETAGCKWWAFVHDYDSVNPRAIAGMLRGQRWDVPTMVGFWWHNTVTGPLTTLAKGRGVYSRAAMAILGERMATPVCPVGCGGANCGALASSRALPAIGAPFRKFLSEQLKDRSSSGGGTTAPPPPAAVDPKRTYRVRLAVFERARYGDFYKWCVRAWGGGVGRGAARAVCCCSVRPSSTPPTHLPYAAVSHSRRVCRLPARIVCARLRHVSMLKSIRVSVAPCSGDAVIASRIAAGVAPSEGSDAPTATVKAPPAAAASAALSTSAAACATPDSVTRWPLN
jgi:hypothetical protein